jgi:hypothetical protein
MAIIRLQDTGLNEDGHFVYIMDSFSIVLFVLKHISFF